jgi:hypothetical protein
MTEALSTAVSDSPRRWPALPRAAWRETCDTLHLWAQIVGKTRLALAPLVNHWWNVPLYVSSRGLTTSAIPLGERVLEIEFNFISHVLDMRLSDGTSRQLHLAPRSVADFYAEYMSALKAIGVNAHIWKMPVEIADPIPFDQDRAHAAYDREYAQRFWRVLVSVNQIFGIFRSGFVGKSSPVHFFWGSFDLAVSRFSGRRAPKRDDADPVLAKIVREAYSHEVISAGWWPGTNDQDAAFYAYAAPVPEGLGAQRVYPEKAFYHQGLGEFILNYDDMRREASPARALIEFLESTYAAAAGLAKWDRAALERQTAPPPEEGVKGPSSPATGAA